MFIFDCLFFGPIHIWITIDFIIGIILMVYYYTRACSKTENMSFFIDFIYIDSRWCTKLLQDSILLSPENRSLGWLRDCIRIWVDNMRKCRLFTLWNGIMSSSYVLTKEIIENYILLEINMNKKFIYEINFSLLTLLRQTTNISYHRILNIFILQ